MAIEVYTLSPKATEMDSKTTTISLTKPLSPLETTVTEETMTSEDNTATTWTTPTAKEETTSSVETTLPVEITESMGVMILTEVTTSASQVTTASESELAKVTTTFVSSTEATSSSATTTEPNVRIYKTLTISNYFVNQSDVIPDTTLHFLLTDYSESHCFTSEAEVDENGYVTFIFQADDEHLITSGIYKYSCIELASVTTINLD